MAKYTTKYKLKKPEPDDFYNVQDQNGNMDIIEEALTEKSDVGHTQPASSITAGVLPADVVAAAGTDYSISRLRNGVFTTEDPGANASTGYANGSIIYVYE